MNVKILLKRLTIFVLTFCMIFSSAINQSVFANEIEQNINPINSNGIKFSAGIYLDADRTDIDTILTSQGSLLEDWTFETDRYLGVVVSGLPMDDSQYRVVIEMDKIIYLNQTIDPVLSNTTVSFKQNDPFTVNTTSQYKPMKYSLSNLTYLINKNTESITIGLPIRYDINLWNKKNGALLGDGETPLLKVYLEKQLDDGTFEIVENCDTNLLQATSSGSISNSPAVNIYRPGETSGGGTTVMGINESRVMYARRATNITTSCGYYYKDFKAEIRLPTCTINGVIHTLNYDPDSIRLTVGSGNPAIDTKLQDGILIINAKDVYYTGGTHVSMAFCAPESIKNINSKLNFSGNIKVTVDNDIKIIDNPITITVDNSSNAELSMSTTSGVGNVLNPNSVQFLGLFKLANKAAFENASGPLEVFLNFDANNTKAVKVTTARLVCDRKSQYINVIATFVDENGNPVVDKDNNIIEYKKQISNPHYTTASTTEYDNRSLVFKRNDLPPEYNQYYFKTIKYTIGSLPGNTYCYASSADKSSGGAGSIWGYVVENTPITVKPVHSIQVYKVKDNNEKEIMNELSKELTVGLTESQRVAYGLGGGNHLSTNAITAGDSFTLKGNVNVVSYPYGESTTLNNIRLAFELPIGVKVNEASISAKYSAGVLPVDSVTYKTIDNSKYLCLIKFKPGEEIGYFNENLQPISNGDIVTYSIQFNTETTLSNQTINFTEISYGAGLNQSNASGGSYAYYAKTDLYDINENNRTNDNVAGFNSTKDITITISSLPAKLQISEDLSKEDGSKGSSLTFESFADVVNYNLYVNCVEGGTASGFYYIIPVGKTRYNDSNEFVENCDVDINLMGAPSLTTKNGTEMVLYYSTTPVDNYSSASTVTDWSTKLPEGKRWEDVTLIKVVSKDEIIINGTQNVISLPLGYLDEDIEDQDLAYQHLAGYTIQWHSRGYYAYQLGHNSSAGMQSTEGVKITLVYTPEEPIEFTLTAAKDGKPKDENAVTTRSFSLPRFMLAQKYSVKEIMPYNMKLVDESYDFSKVNGAEANENFRINISVKDYEGQIEESKSIAIQKENDIIGSLTENKIPQFTFTIENANALSDIVTERYVTMTLIGDNGVIVPVRININRELAAAEATKSAIIDGEMYVPFDSNESTQVVYDSAFTAQFVTNYIPVNYKNHRLEFEKAPEIGTTIVLIDRTYSNDLRYYHYTFDNSKTTILLTEFDGMGNSNDFTANETNMVSEVLLFIVTFPDNTTFTKVNNTLVYKKDIKTGEDETVPSVLSYETVDDRNFSISTSKNNVKIDEKFEVSYTSAYTHNLSIKDSRYTDRNLSIVISGDNLPNDSRLTVDNNNYYLNSNGQFIIPLKSVQNGNGSIDVTFNTKSNANMTLQAQLWASATANGLSPMMGESVTSPISIVVNAKELPSFKVLNMSDRTIKEKELSNTFNLNFSKLNSNNVTIEVQKKTGADYVTQTTVLEAVNGKTTADAGQGTFIVESNNNVSLKLSKSTPAGTYRVLFRVYSKDGKVEVPYNFIVY